MSEQATEVLNTVSIGATLDVGEDSYTISALKYDPESRHPIYRIYKDTDFKGVKTLNGALQFIATATGHSYPNKVEEINAVINKGVEAVTERQNRPLARPQNHRPG